MKLKMEKKKNWRIKIRIRSRLSWRSEDIKTAQLIRLGMAQIALFQKINKDEFHASF